MRALTWLLALWLGLAPAFADSAFVAPTANGTAAVGQLPGTTTNDAAAAGKVGEFNTSDILVGSAVSLTSNVAANLTSLTLQPGDYNVFCTVIFADTGTTLTNYLLGSLSTTSATTVLARGQSTSYTYATAGIANTNLTNISLTVGPYHVQVATASTTQVFCVGQAGFGVSTMAIYGGMSAQRIR